jgi:hypothetical protein
MTGKIEFVGELRRVDVKPGDRYVIMFPGPIGAETAHLVRLAWRRFAGTQRNGFWTDEPELLLLPDGAKLGVIRSDEEP